MKKKFGISTVIIILLLIVVGLIFTYIYIEDKKLDKKALETVNKVKKEKKEEIKEEEIALDNDLVKQAIDSLNSIDRGDRYNDFNISSLDKYNLIETAINGLDNDQITWCISSPSQIKATISIDDLNNALSKNIRDQKLTIDDIKNSKGETSLTVGQYGYGSFAITIDNDNIHIIGSCDGRGPGLLADTVIGNPYKAITKGDELYVYTRVAYGRINRTTNELSYDYYKDSSRTGEIVETVALNNDLTWEKYDTFKQIYKKYDEKYYFISSKKD